MSEKKKPKRGIIDKSINIICYLVIVYFAINEFSHLYRTLRPINQNPDLYERHYVITSTFPFIGSYFLMPPKDYNPQYSYPLIIALHGVSNNVYAAEALSKPSMRKHLPSFVMVPIAPKRAFWATPEDKAYQMKRNIPYADHLPFVVTGVNEIKENYNIDPKRIIMTGHSMGGSGALAAMQRYPDIFTAAIASSGAWSPKEIDRITKPIFVYHGTHDGAVPVKNAFAIKSAAKAQNKPIIVQTLKGRGHDIGDMLYARPSVWNDILKITE